MSDQSFDDRGGPPRSKQELINLIREHTPVRPPPGQTVKSINIGGMLAGGRMPTLLEIPQMGGEDKDMRDE